MNVPKDLFFTKEHEWISVKEDTGVVGITDHAQKELGDVVFVDLPEPGSRFESGEAFGSVESVKAVSEVYSPATGRIVEVNSSLSDAPETINQDPYAKGWMVKIKLEDTTELHNLMSADDYTRYLQEELGE